MSSKDQLHWYLGAIDVSDCNGQDFQYVSIPVLLYDMKTGPRASCAGTSYCMDYS